MYSGQRISGRDLPTSSGPRRTKRRRRHSAFPLLAAGLILGVCLGWNLRGALSTQASAASPKAPGSASGQSGTLSPAPPAQPAEPGLKAPPDCPDWITEDLLTVNEYSRPGTRLDAVSGIVVHYVGNPGTTARQNHSYFQNLASTGETYASSHFLVGLEGEILQNVPLDEVAYCSSSRNSDTISIECCHPDSDGAFTRETYNSLVRLVKWLMEYYELDASQVIRHYDVTGKECPLYYVRNPEEWEAFLTDLTQS